MGTGVSLLLIVIGAVLAWAVSATTSGLNVHAVGYILLVVGIIGLALSMIFWSTWAGPGYFTGTARGRRRTVTETGPGVQERRTVVEDEERY